MNDPIRKPDHYQHPLGLEAIDVTRYLPFNLGNAVKYIWRGGKKDTSTQGLRQDLKKARWYLQDEIALLEGRQYRRDLVAVQKWIELLRGAIRADASMDAAAHPGLRLSEVECEQLARLLEGLV